MQKTSSPIFLAANPFPNPLTDGFSIARRCVPSIDCARHARLRASSGEVLEVGGGRSGLAALLYPRRVGGHDRSIAISPSSVTARRRERRFVCGDACALPFADGTFDAVTLFDVLEHIDADADAAREAWRVVRPGGWILVSTPNADWHYPYIFIHATSGARPRPTSCRNGVTCAAATRPEALAALFGAGPSGTRPSSIRRRRFFHDVAFSNLGRRRRKALYALAAPLAAVGYATHRLQVARNGDGLCMASRLSDAPAIAIFPWGDVVEDFLDPLGLELSDFVETMSGGWLFGYVEALRFAGFRPVVICASAAVQRSEHRIHRATGASIWIVPGRSSALPYSSRRSGAQWWRTPWRAFAAALRHERCTRMLVQEYEYARFDALAVLGRLDED